VENPERVHRPCAAELMRLNVMFCSRAEIFLFVQRLPGCCFAAPYPWGTPTPSPFSSLRLGAGASPMDKAQKQGALPPLTSKKLSTLELLFKRTAGPNPQAGEQVSG